MADVTDAQFQALENRVANVEASAHNNGQAISSLQQDVKNLQEEDKRQQKKDIEHDEKLADHERRLKSIENPLLEYKVEEWRLTNVFKFPSVDENGNAIIYMPPFTKEELRACNEDIPGVVSYKWYQKIFNPREQGDVSFDFDRSQSYLRSINIGPHATINIPVPIILLNNADERRVLLIECAAKGLVLSTVKYNTDLEDSVVTIYNFTNSTINIKTGEPLFKVSVVYGYPVELKLNTD